MPTQTDVNLITITHHIHMRAHHPRLPHTHTRKMHTDGKRKTARLALTQWQYVLWFVAPVGDK